MKTKSQQWTVARQIAFFMAADEKGKWHAAWKIGHTAVCGVPQELSQIAIRTAEGEQSAKVHPMVCRRCLRLSTTSGVSAIGMEQ